MSVGGSVHKTTHADFVWESLISAVISGNIFASLMLEKFAKAINLIHNDNESAFRFLMHLCTF